MAQYEIKDVVCDYGLYEDGELKLILNSAHNANIIKRILEIDSSVPNVATPADFVEVCRCKDCKDYCAVMFKGEPMHYGYCCNTHDSVLENRHRYEGDFCSYGVKKGK